jgi:ribulose-phosphate 3-epimerase
LMTVNPGFGGQSFISAVLDKIARVKALVGSRPIDIEVDGGITVETAPLVAKAGANVMVAGSSIFERGADYRARVEALRGAAESALRKVA